MTIGQILTRVLDRLHLQLGSRQLGDGSDTSTLTGSPAARQGEDHLSPVESQHREAHVATVYYYQLDPSESVPDLGELTMSAAATRMAGGSRAGSQPAGAADDTDPQAPSSPP